MKSNVLQNKKAAQRVFVAMSGGVDSSVAALLLRNEGYDVVGVFMRCYNLDGCAERDAEDARRVAEKLSIPFYVWDFEDEYKKKVVKYMVDGYRKGITPNPDVMCNKEIKFGLFFERSLALGADYVATGHYAQVRELKTLRRRRIRLWRKNSKLKTFGLFQAQDKNKDQSYFLWTLTQDQLARCLFPIGEYLKPEVRAIARKAGLPTADKKDSQGICFLGDVSITDFLKKYIRTKRGNILATSGAKIGEHDGAYFYTIGQRHLGISNIKYPAGGEARMGRQKSKTERDAKPFYVAEKDVKTNTLVVAEGKDNKELYKKEI
ncbi:MAG: tRNA 2-thiouridine(34) synthase MnmA, partial [Patescibacteria group bacterium]